MYSIILYVGEMITMPVSIYLAVLDKEFSITASFPSYFFAVFYVPLYTIL